MEPSTFTELCEKIEPELVNSIATNAVFKEMALGTLSMERFQRFIQQDHLFLRKYFINYTIMADKEDNPARKDQLNKYHSAGESYMHLMISYYREFEFKEATCTETYTQHYIDLLRNAAMESSIAESLGACYAAHRLWQAASVELAKIAIYEGNIYSRFVKALTADISTSLIKFQNFVDDYYTQATRVERQNMMKNYALALRLEGEFFDGVFRNV